MIDKYVISVKDKNEDKWLYPCIDRQVGYPTMSDLQSTIFFNTPDEAADWWEKNMKYALLYYHNDVDISTLSVRKLMFEEVTNIKLDGNWSSPFTYNSPTDTMKG